MTKHKQVTINHEDFSAEVDEKIADLILNLWKLDIYTTLSCQNNVPKNYVWIEFGSAMGAEQFLNIVAEYDEDDDSVYQNMICKWSDLKKEWQYSVTPTDYGVIEHINEDTDTIESEFTGEHFCALNISVRFPQKHLDFVKNQVRRALQESINGQMTDAVNSMIEEIIKQEKVQNICK